MGGGYAYAGNNPVNGSDPSGLTTSCFGACDGVEGGGQPFSDPCLSCYVPGAAGTPGITTSGLGTSTLYVGNAFNPNFPMIEVNASDLDALAAAVQFIQGGGIPAGFDLAYSSNPGWHVIRDVASKGIAGIKDLANRVAPNLPDTVIAAGYVTAGGLLRIGSGWVAGQVIGALMVATAVDPGLFPITSLLAIGTVGAFIWAQNSGQNLIDQGLSIYFGQPGYSPSSPFLPPDAP